MAYAVRINKAEDLPWSVKANLGLGRSKIKMFSRPDGDLIVTATRDISDVRIKLIYIHGDKSRSLELSDQELNKISLMAKDIRKMTGLNNKEYSDSITED